MPKVPVQPISRPVASPLRRGLPILVKTDNYLLRTMRETDANSRFMNWLMDEEILRGLNLPPRQWTVETLRRFIVSFDNTARHLIGICDRKTNELVGFYTLDINLVHQTSQLTAAIGEKEYVGRRVLFEATPKLVDYLFANRGIEKVSARVLASNRRMLFNFIYTDVFHYEACLKQEVIAPSGKREDLLVFSVLKNP